jgi:hypothetical protein
VTDVCDDRFDARGRPDSDHGLPPTDGQQLAGLLDSIREGNRYVVAVGSGEPFLNELRSMNHALAQGAQFGGERLGAALAAHLSERTLLDDVGVVLQDL